MQAGENTVHPSDPRGGYSVIPPIDDLLWDNPCFPGRVDLCLRPRASTPFYADSAALDGSSRRSSQLMELIMEQGADWG